MKQYLTTLLSAVMIAGALPCSGEVPRPEHPRPDQFRENWVTLNGEWQFEIDDKADGGTRGLTHGKDLSDRIIVPFCPESKLSGTRDYQLHVLTEVLRDKLRKGTNTIALHTRKQRDATYLDLGILIDNGSVNQP